jgi:hypothetical protein
MNELEELSRATVAFRDQRDWKQFHSLRNLAAGLSIEAVELQEILLWKSPVRWKHCGDLPPASDDSGRKLQTYWPLACCSATKLA